MKMRKIFSFRKIIFLSLIVIISLLAVFADFKGLLQTPKSMAADIFLPVSNFFYQLNSKSTDYLSALFSAGTVARINQELTAQNLKMQSDLVKLQEVIRENSVLKNQLEIKKTQKEDYHYIMASVFGYNPTNLGQYLFIDKGSRDGIAKDAAVVASGDVLVGKISEVFPTKAKVMLISDSNSAINALAQKNRSSGVLKGNQGMGVFLEMVPRDKDLETGEYVISAGSGDNFPKGLLIGEIAEIMVSDVEAFKQAKIKPAADLDALEAVFVIAP